MCINEKIIMAPKMPAEIIIARKNAMTIYNTKIDDMAMNLTYGLPKFSKEEKIDHYCKKLQLVWEGRLCLE
jgi:hypothetical protein